MSGDITIATWVKKKKKSYFRQVKKYKLRWRGSKDIDDCKKRSEDARA